MIFNKNIDLKNYIKTIIYYYNNNIKIKMTSLTFNFNNYKSSLSIKTVLIIDKLCSVLEKLVLNNNCTNNNTYNSKNNSIFKKSSFDLNSKPNIDFKSYISRIIYYSKISDNTIIYCLVIIDKFLNKTEIKINNNNLYLIVLTGLQIAMKLNEDIILKDCDYCFLGMINYKLLAFNEAIFLQGIEYSPFVNQDEFICYYELFN